MKLPSKKFTMSYVGPLYVFSRYDKYMYTIATLNGEIIEQMFHVSRLKKGYVRTPTGVTVNTISNYKLECAKAASTANPLGNTVTKLSTSKDVDLTTMKEVFHVSLKGVSKPPDSEEMNIDKEYNDNNDIVLSEHYKYIWYENAEVLLNYTNHSIQRVQLPNLLCHNPDSHDYTRAYIDSSVGNTDGMHQSYVITKARFEFGSLQVYSYVNCTDEVSYGIWENIP